MREIDVLTAGNRLDVLRVTGGGCSGGGDRQLSELLLRLHHLGVGLGELQSQCLR